MSTSHEKDTNSEPEIALYPKKEAVENESNTEIDERNPQIFLDPKKRIGQGRHGIVYAATHYGADCVAKKMQNFKEEEAKHMSKKAFEKEIGIIRQLRHPNIIQLLEVCQIKGDPDSQIIVMSKMSMTLNDFLQKGPGTTFLYKKIGILHDIICGLHYLHKNDIIHRDLTVNAIFLTENLGAIIADFGQAKRYDKTKIFTTVPGEFSHMPPEALNENAQYTVKLDIFSFGCVVIQVITNKMPVPCYETHSRKKLPNGMSIKIPEFERREKHINKIIELKLHEIYRVVEKCLQDQPEDRPMASEIMVTIKNHKETLPKTQECALYEKPKVDLIEEHIKLSTLLAEKCKTDYHNEDLDQEVEKSTNVIKKKESIDSTTAAGEFHVDT